MFLIYLNLIDIQNKIYSVNLVPKKRIYKIITNQINNFMVLLFAYDSQK